MDSYIAAAVSAAMQPVLLELRALSDQISQISAWFPHVLATVDAVESLQGDTLGQLFEVKGQLLQAGDNRGAALCELALCEKSKPARPQNKVSKRTMGRKVLKPPPPCKPSLEKRLPTGSHPSISSNPATSWPPQPITVYPINSKPAFTLTGTVNGHRGTLLIGTGSAVTLVDRKAANTYQIVPTLQRVKGVTGDYLRLYGETQCSLVLPDPGRGTAPNTSVKIPARRKGPLLGDGCLQTFQPYDLGQICPTTRHSISSY
ncbi:unnamed protein product [Nesidiocoris tenuis]|uniref:Uncharacterized protein n=1 Tax=Nesidiocoris tenuis TaxID=355587 RepID=A0A6H5GT01_9HEMI|nr:unnamed protein product [Nesidiocoris tenuis]